jgi:hypothetical protein
MYGIATQILTWQVKLATEPSVRELAFSGVDSTTLPFPLKIILTTVMFRPSIAIHAETVRASSDFVPIKPAQG